MRVVHIGFPKTATTFLQKRLFPQLPRRFRYLDKETSAPFFAELMNYDDTLFDAERTKRRFQQAWEDRSDALFSFEPLTGLHYQSAFVNRTLIAERLKESGFERVIITIRNQFDALESAYKQYVKSGGVLKFNDYINFDPANIQYLYPEYFDYFLIYRLYADQFGARNVLMLQYENLHKESFRDEICSFLGIEPFDVAFDHRLNPSLSSAKTKLLRVVNHLTYNSFRPSHLISRRISTAFFHRQLSRIPLLNRDKSFLDTPTRNAIASFYKEPNRKLRECAGIALTADYP